MVIEHKLDKIDWNLSALIAEELGGLLAKATNNYLNGNLPNMFYCLKAIKMRVIQNIKVDERKILSDKEKEIDKQILNLKFIGKKKRKELFIAQSNLARTIEEYNELVLDLLDKYEFLFKKQSDHKRMF